MSITVSVHLKPYVKHYLEHRYGVPVSLPRKSKVKSLFLAALCKHFEPGRKKYLKELPAIAEFKLSKHDMSTHGLSVDEQHSFFINGVFEEKLKNEMFYEISVKRFAGTGMKLSDAIVEWQEENGFTDEVFNFETIRRAYYDIINKKTKFSPKRSQHTMPC